MNDWQPIETAPKGELILISGGTFDWSDSYNGAEGIIYPGVTIAQYSVAYNEWRGENSGGHDCYYWHKPTHWMPLPKPPVQS